MPSPVSSHVWAVIGFSNGRSLGRESANANCAGDQRYRRLKKKKRVAEAPPPVCRLDASRVELLVIFRRMLVLLEAFGIVRHEYLAVLRIPDPLDIGVPVHDLGWVIGQPDARLNILCEVLLQVAGIAGQYDG